jgi:hypothetical protein
MSMADRDEKFMDCAGRVLGGQGARALLDLANDCGTLADVRALARATVPAVDGGARSAEAKGMLTA